MQSICMKSAAKPPSEVIGEYHKACAGNTMSEKEIEDLAKKVLLPVCPLLIPWEIIGRLHSKTAQGVGPLQSPSHPSPTPARKGWGGACN